MVSVWEAIFMLVVLKIPLVYLGVVIWWAVRAEPEPHDGGEPIGALLPLTPCGWDECRRRRTVRRRGLRPLAPVPRPGARTRMRVA